MMHTGVDSILHEVRKVIVGKDDVLEKILMTILSGGHVLLDDVPGTGKTTTALASAAHWACNMAASSSPPTYCPRISWAFPCTAGTPARSPTSPAR